MKKGAILGFLAGLGLAVCAYNADMQLHPDLAKQARWQAEEGLALIMVIGMTTFIGGALGKIKELR